MPNAYIIPCESTDVVVAALGENELPFLVVFTSRIGDGGETKRPATKQMRRLGCQAG